MCLAKCVVKNDEEQSVVASAVVCWGSTTGVGDTNKLNKAD